MAPENDEQLSARLRKKIDDADSGNDDRAAQQRAAGIAIGVLFLLVLLLLMAIISGGTDAYQP